jgi:hypothetical protein
MRVTRGNSVFRIKNTLYRKFANITKINNDAPMEDIIQVINFYIFNYK